MLKSLWGWGRSEVALWLPGDGWVLAGASPELRAHAACSAAGSGQGHVWVLQSPALLRISTPSLRTAGSLSLQLCHDRGYLVTQDELDQTLEEFKAQFGDKPSEGRPRRTDLTVLVAHNDDPTDQMFVFFPGGWGPSFQCQCVTALSPLSVVFRFLPASEGGFHPGPALAAGLWHAPSLPWEPSLVQFVSILCPLLSAPALRHSGSCLLYSVVSTLHPRQLGRCLMRGIATLGICLLVSPNSLSPLISWHFEVLGHVFLV